MNDVLWFLKALPFFLLFQFSFSLDAITPQNSIRDGDVVVSTGNMFALGFFSPGAGSSKSQFRYVGIWYNRVAEQTVVWVANREKPINDTSGILSIDSRGNLVLHGGNQTDPVWSTNASVAHSSNCVARLHDSGNLVLAQNGTPLWQSFDYPTNTIVSFMKLGLNLSSGLNRFITSWKSENDPGNGNYSYRIDPSGLPQLIFYKDSRKFWRAGSWTGKRWSGIPDMTRAYIFNNSYVNNNEEVSIVIGIKDPSIISRLVANETGFMQRHTWNAHDQRWILIWEAPKENCDNYRQCGPNSNCDGTHADEFMCSCLPGFEPKSPQTWFLRDGSDGCILKPNASICQRGEGFVKVARVKLPDTSAAQVDMSLGLKLCRDKCFRNCSCMAYASALYENTNGGTGCATWHGDMVDIRTYSDAGQDLYVRVDAVDLARYRNNGKLSKKSMMAIIIVSVALFCMAVFAFCYLRKKRRHRRPSKSSLNFITRSESLNESKAELPLFDLVTIAAATNNFSSDNKLGQGGFGPVYKGTLNGKEIAVKRLSKSSGQGIEEFKNEITLIAKLQHRNLVRILGCCIDKEEKMVVYEYLPNKSLDSFIFDESKRSVLVWERRCEIICGIARGIVYLHQDSRLRIIHRDLKANNILLDAEMNPKISDFGMARIFGADQIEANTNRVVGTYGYMAPEYAMEGHFSIKSDVYSFGVLLLEIITGRRNSGHYPDSPTSNLIGHVWDLWRNDKAMEIIDSSLGGSYPAAEVLRYIQIGLLCVQESAADRPKMSAVVAMLGNDASLPSPKQPAFIIKKANKGDETGSSEGTTGSINELTLTLPLAR